IQGVVLKSCYFQNTSLERSSLSHMRFLDCHFDALDLSATARIDHCALIKCEVVSLARPDSDIRMFDPLAVRAALTDGGFSIEDPEATQTVLPLEPPDDETEVAERAIRLFLRASHVNQEVFKLRLRTKSNLFFADVLPELLRVGVLEETQYAGSGRGRRFRLAVPMQLVDQALRQSHGHFATFIEVFG